jgi:GTP pyrophosphokinase
MATAKLMIDSFRTLFDQCAEYMDRGALEMVRHAYLMAERAHRGTVRHSGEKYIEHPLAVALWLAQRRVTADVIVAALLHDVVEDTPVSLQRVRNQFGSVVAKLVDGVTKFEAVEEPDDRDELARKRERKRRQQAETIRKLLLTMAEDPRTALIKIADRLHNLRTLAAVPPEKQAPKARETLEIFVPLATRLGMGEAKYEMEDLALRYTDPQRYHWLKDQIALETARRDACTQATLHALQRVLAQHRLVAEVTPHVKHLFSVHRRLLETGNNNLAEMADFITYTVLVPAKHDCYVALHAIHDQWYPIDRRVRDYIGAPKLNGYQSLHTTVFGLVGFEDPFDIQIRTAQMQQIADHGPVLLAATRPGEWHSSDASQAWLDQVHSWQKELSLSATDLVEAVRGDLFQDQIFIFTPKGEIKDVPQGATVLDFAYRIHTHLGEHCAGARVTGNDNIQRLEGRDYELRDRDTVQILTEETIVPDASWLRSAQTHHARDTIAHYLRSHELPLAEPAPDDALSGAGRMPTVHLGWCCEPTPDDEIIGIITGQRLMVHRIECRYAVKAMSAMTRNEAEYHENGHAICGDDAGAPNQQIAPPRWFHVRWETLHPAQYRVSLLLTGSDRSGLIHDITEVFARYDLNIMFLGALSISTRSKAVIRVTVDVQQPEQLRRACQQLRHLDAIVRVQRRQRVPQSPARSYP